ncbi:hypothetical protein [Subtercola endophyticus]|uniref:hypothetical protein n=1 Tax=Subtercola endophyticus TaxID=2895559 RepID=UPI001E62E274|nr:hypothetical protein [Subtercola endophyticus]UFS59785.1 hypothetical protein LQ955_03045 [Subtercola endophyticus]
MPEPFEDEPLELASWQMIVGILRSEDLPDLATDALVRGVDSPSLRVLAGADADDVRESRDLFVDALAELNISILDEDA